MTAGKHTLDLDGLSSRSPIRAAMLLHLATAGDRWLVLQDADSLQFLLPPWLRTYDRWSFFGLSADGRFVVASDSHGGRRIGLHELRTGRERWFTGAPEQSAIHGAATLDGELVAVLSAGRDLEKPCDLDAGIATVTILDTASGKIGTLFRAAGGVTVESSIGWSPDGRHVAATYYAVLDEADPEEGYPRSVVLDQTGAVVIDLEWTMIVPSGNAAWSSDTEILCLRDGGEALLACDLVSGKFRRVWNWTWPRWRVGHRFIVDSDQRVGGGPRFHTVKLDGSDPRPLLEITDQCSILRVEVAAADAIQLGAD